MDLAKSPTTMKRCRFVVELTANHKEDKYKYLAWVLEEGIRKMQTDLVTDRFYIHNARVLKKAPK